MCFLSRGIAIFLINNEDGMMTSAGQINTALKAEVKRRLFEECHMRIISCVDMLSEDELWWRPNNESNSIGNLILHLEGNVRQWIIGGISGAKDVRQRQQEFEERGPMAVDVLLSRLDETMILAEEVIENVSEDVLLEHRDVQTFNETVLSILIHVTEHFAYHTGQIAWITKRLLDKQLGFYDGIDLE